MAIFTGNSQAVPLGYTVNEPVASTAVILKNGPIDIKIENVNKSDISVIYPPYIEGTSDYNATVRLKNTKIQKWSDNTRNDKTIPYSIIEATPFTPIVGETYKFKDSTNTDVNITCLNKINDVALMMTGYMGNSRWKGETDIGGTYYYLITMFNTLRKGVSKCYYPKKDMDIYGLNNEFTTDYATTVKSIMQEASRVMQNVPYAWTGTKNGDKVWVIKSDGTYTNYGPASTFAVNCYSFHLDCTKLYKSGDYLYYIP